MQPPAFVLTLTVATTDGNKTEHTFEALDAIQAQKLLDGMGAVDEVLKQPCTTLPLRNPYMIYRTDQVISITIKIDGPERILASVQPQEVPTRPLGFRTS